MAARGSIAKATITQKLLETFEGSFSFNGGKEIRVPIEENGEIIQIKITLTAAKENVDGGVATATTAKPEEINSELVPPTEKDLEEVEDFVKSLGL